MLGLPKATEMSKQLPKKNIYAKFQMSNTEKERLDADISRITIVNEISSAKVNIADGEKVKSFFVLLVALKRKDFDEKNIAALSKLISQNMLFVLEYKEECRLAIYHTKLMQTDWKPTEEQRIELKGLNLDAVWENIVKGIAFDNEELAVSNEELTLDEKLAIQDRIQKLKKEIERLEKKARAEKQPKKKFEIVSQIRKLNKELENV